MSARTLKQLQLHADQQQHERNQHNQQSGQKLYLATAPGFAHGRGRFGKQLPETHEPLMDPDLLENPDLSRDGPARKPSDPCTAHPGPPPTCCGVEFL